MEIIKDQTYSNFKRYCKFLELQDDPELIETYKQFHAPGKVWPEITQGMKEVGILDMEIYLCGNVLCMIMETVPDFNHDTAMAELSEKPRQSEWEQVMNQFQNSDSETASDKWALMERIYEMDK
mgnify:CR=1 FL=1|jgi:L-rhamnose mutarotase